MPPQIREFTTEDMALVAVLKAGGIEPDRMNKTDGGCQWIYVRCEALNETVDEYGRGEAYVEPKEFAQKLGLVRREMYRYLGVAPKRVRS